MKVLVVDDHPLIRAALESVIADLGEAVTVSGVGSAQAARAALAQDPEQDLILLDLSLSDAHGLDVLVELRRCHPSIPVVVVSASDRSGDVIRALDEGAMGFIPKQTPNEVLLQALRVVMAGGVYVPPVALSGDDGHRAPQGVGLMRTALAPPKLHGALSLESLRLTVRQTEVLHLLLQGQPNKIIARELGLSVETIKDHVAALLRTLGVTSRTQAVLMVSQMLRKDAQGATGSSGRVTPLSPRASASSPRSEG